jgi:hypothetical protein
MAGAFAARPAIPRENRARAAWHTPCSFVDSGRANRARSAKKGKEPESVDPDRERSERPPRAASAGKLLLVAAALGIPESAHALGSAVSVGASEVVDLPAGGPGALYPYGALSAFLEIGRWSLGPSIGGEIAPEIGRWGLFWSFWTELSIVDWMGLEVEALLVHDQPGARFARAELWAGAGAGLSFAYGNWSVGPQVDVLRDVASPASAAAVGLELCRSFE